MPSFVAMVRQALCLGLGPESRGTTINGTASGNATATNTQDCLQSSGGNGKTTSLPVLLHQAETAAAPLPSTPPTAGVSPALPAGAGGPSFQPASAATAAPPNPPSSAAAAAGPGATSLPHSHPAPAAQPRHSSAASPNTSTPAPAASSALGPPRRAPGLPDLGKLRSAYSSAPARPSPSLRTYHNSIPPGHHLVCIQCTITPYATMAIPAGCQLSLRPPSIPATHAPLAAVASPRPQPPRRPAAMPRSASCCAATAMSPDPETRPSVADQAWLKLHATAAWSQPCGRPNRYPAARATHQPRPRARSHPESDQPLSFAELRRALQRRTASLKALAPPKPRSALEGMMMVMHYLQASASEGPGGARRDAAQQQLPRMKVLRRLTTGGSLQLHAPPC